MVAATDSKDPWASDVKPGTGAGIAPKEINFAPLSDFSKTTTLIEEKPISRPTLILAIYNHCNHNKIKSAKREVSYFTLYVPLMRLYVPPGPEEKRVLDSPLSYSKVEFC